MKKTKEMFAGGFYLLQGQSSANSSFIEDKAEAIRFMEECKKRLLNFAEIHDYLLTKDGWVLLISLLDEETIKSSYKKNWDRSIRVKKENYLEEVWKIISEQIRQIRFTFVRYSNKKNGREGSKVKRSYERYWFESVDEAHAFIGKMKKQLIRLCQRRKTYRSKKRHFRISKAEQIGAVFLCSLRVKTESDEKSGAACCLKILESGSDVVRQLVTSTIYHHNSTKSTIYKPKIE